MPYILNKLEAETIYAFLEALARQTAPLPLELQQKIKQLSQILTTDPKKALDTLLIDLTKDEYIQPIYKQIRQEIDAQYQPIEMNEFVSIGADGDTQNALSELLDNLTAVAESPTPKADAEQDTPKRKTLFARVFKRSDQVL